MAPPGPQAGRFRAKYDPLTLVELVVPAVAQAAGVHDGDPRSISQRAYDQARAQSRFPDAPTADATSRRLGVAWRELLVMIFDQARSEIMTLGAANRRAGRRAIPAIEAISAIRFILSRSDSQRGLDPASYDLLRDELVQKDRRAWLHGGDLDDILPTSHQIREACRNEFDAEGWLTALSAAGSARRVEPPRSVQVVQALEWFVCDAGWLPSGRPQLAAYARAKGFALQFTKKGIGAEIQQLRADRAARGLWTPGRAPRAGQRPAFEVVPMANPSRAAPNLRLTYERILDALIWAIDDLGGERTLTQDAYQAWCNRRPHAPSLSSVQRVAARVGKTFAQARTDALKRRSTRGPGSLRPKTVRLDFYGIGDGVIVIEPTPRQLKPRAKRGRPRKYASHEEKLAARREQRRRAREAKADERRRERERRLEERRRRGPQPRRQYRRSDGQRIGWSDLIDAGLVSADTEIFTTLRGRRYVAHYTGSGFHVPGRGLAETLSGAAALIAGGPRDGWSFWSVGDGGGVPVRELRERLYEIAPAGSLRRSGRS